MIKEMEPSSRPAESQPPRYLAWFGLFARRSSLASLIGNHFLRRTLSSHSASGSSLSTYMTKTLVLCPLAPLSRHSQKDCQPLLGQPCHQGLYSHSLQGKRPTKPLPLFSTENKHRPRAF